MFWRMVSGSVRHRRGRLSIVLVAIALGSTLVSGLFNLSGDIGQQVGQELRAYGANILIRPRDPSIVVGSGALEFGTIAAAQTIAEADLKVVEQNQAVTGIVPYLHALVEINGQPAILTGVDLASVQANNPWWQVQGQWPQADDELLVGTRVAERLALETGGRLTVGYGNETWTLRVAGILETGGDEDDQLIVDLDAAQALTDQPGQVDLVMVSAVATDQPLDEIAQELQTQMPGAEVRTLAQFAQAEKAVLDKVRLLLGLVAALVMLTGALTVGGTLHTITIERRVEIGLMKALGATNRRVTGLFLAEALSTGAIGGLLGYMAGVGLAITIGRRVFDATITLTPVGLPLTIIMALGVTLLASLLPMQRAAQVDPAKTLKGE